MVKFLIRITKSIFLIPKEIRNNIAKRVYYRVLPLISALMLINGLLLKPLHAPSDIPVTELLLTAGGLYTLLFSVLSRYKKIYTFGYSFGMAFINFILVLMNGGINGPGMSLFYISITVALVTVEHVWKKVFVVSVSIILGLSVFAITATAPTSIMLITDTRMIMYDSLSIYISSLAIFITLCTQLHRSIMYHRIHERHKFDSFRLNTNERSSQLSKELNLDALTGVFNKRYATKLIQNLTFGLSIKADTEIVVAMLDIDLFKKINDTYGHDIGDETLIGVADTLKKSIRKNDYVIRYGGEEFLIIMTMISFEDAVRILNNIRIEVGLQVYTSKRIKVTMSAGVAKVFNDETILNAIKRADYCLYYAKQSGRNQLQSTVPEDFKLIIDTE